MRKSKKKFFGCIKTRRVDSAQTRTSASLSKRKAPPTREMGRREKNAKMGYEKGGWNKAIPFTGVF